MMTLIDRILNHSYHARDKRARDPESHAEIPYGTDQPALVRIGAWMLKTSWWERFFLKWSGAISTALTAWLLARGAGDHTAAIVTGVMAAIAFVYEQLSSYLISKATMKIPPHIGGQSLAPIPERKPEKPTAAAFSGTWPWQSLVAQEPLNEDEKGWLETVNSGNGRVRPSEIGEPPPAPPATEDVAPAPAPLTKFEVEVNGIVHPFTDSTQAIKFKFVEQSAGRKARQLF